MIDFLKELFVYSHQMNQQLCMLLTQQPAPERSITLMSHIINAQEIWNSRLETISIQRGVWDVHRADQLLQMDQMNELKTMHILELVDLGSTLQYRNSKGEEFVNTAKDILFHMVNHATHHRGQIATDLRIHGIPPLAMDYIFYKRK